MIMARVGVSPYTKRHQTPTDSPPSTKHLAVQSDRCASILPSNRLITKNITRVSAFALCACTEHPDDSPPAYCPQSTRLCHRVITLGLSRVQYKKQYTPGHHHYLPTQHTLPPYATPFNTPSDRPISIRPTNAFVVQSAPTNASNRSACPISITL